jgi:hypothetical protein
MGLALLVPGRPQNAPGDMVPGENGVGPNGHPFGWLPLPLFPLLKPGEVWPNGFPLILDKKAYRRCSSD